VRILIDEDTAVQLVDPLRHVLVGHDVAHIAGLSWKGKKDRQVLPDAKRAGYQIDDETAAQFFAAHGLSISMLMDRMGGSP
jgi:predicted nuclease of predicted toxin-antitoxin system